MGEFYNILKHRYIKYFIIISAAFFFIFRQPAQAQNDSSTVD